jgi:superfamily I DNA/RNA helicase
LPINDRADELHGDLNALWKQLETEAVGRRPTTPKIAPDLPGFPHSLDEFQAVAASHLDGPIRVLAPAGSGKTRTLTARIAALVSRGVPPTRILALAFNAKAAEEMGDRLGDLGVRGVETRTFHSLGYEIIREAYGWTYDENNESRINDLAKYLFLENLPIPEHPGQAKRFFDSGIKLLRKAKSNLLAFPDMQLYDGEIHHPVGQIFQALITEQQKRQIVTFSDMIYFALRVLLENDDIRLNWQVKHHYVLVDEFQDLNPAQMLLLRILALPQNNLFAVGDDDQLIYAWRGAEVGHILDFGSYYPGSASVVLATNYRSGKRIVRHGRWLIENNKNRVAKDIQSANSANNGKINILLAPTPKEQAEQAISWLERQKDKYSYEWGDFGLLFRTNNDGTWLAEALDRRSIPFIIAGEAEPDIGDPPPEMSDTAVTLMTIHKSKGKEFPCIIYFNLSRRGSALTESDERRVVYVGVTRAKEQLLITADSERYSHFLRELALNPSFSDYAEPFLQRKLFHHYRKNLLRKRKFSAWMASWVQPPDPGTLLQSVIKYPAMEPYATELSFRSILGISIQP